MSIVIMTRQSSSLICQRSLFSISIIIAISLAIPSTSLAQASAAAKTPRLPIASSQIASLDYLTAKLAVDRQIDPTTDAAWVKAEVVRLARAAADMAGPNVDDPAKLRAVRKVIYVAGPWNDNRPFDYDHADPYGKVILNKLLATYLKTRRGNCVSMPILFLILADWLGVKVSLAAAPLHLFVRYTDAAAIRSTLRPPVAVFPRATIGYENRCR